jgi:putative IMPACT (imprinted ancient) family translation regulator
MRKDRPQQRQCQRTLHRHGGSAENAAPQRQRQKQRQRQHSRRIPQQAWSITLRLRSNTRFNRNIRHARHYTIDNPVSAYEPIQRLIAAHRGTIEREEFAATVTLEIIAPDANVAALTRALRTITAGQVQIAAV